jgi:CheY-like chemotaxis protein/HPt (histidine-containing phosphotransfer) domain-containing protein
MSQDNEDILTIFVEEGRDLLNALAMTIQQGSADINNKSHFIDLKRDLHTLKGGARMVNQPELSTFAHELEILCESLAQENIVITREIYNLVELTIAYLKEMLESISRKEKVVVNDNLLDELKKKILPGTIDLKKILTIEHKNRLDLKSQHTQFDVKSTQKKRYTIMVVDDSVTIRTVTKSYLERYQYVVITAKDGLEGWEKLQTHRPDIILLDVEMPKMNGFQFAENVRNHQKFSDIPIIMITFCVGEEQKKLAEKLRIQKFMSKPYQELDLLEAIDNLLRNNNG